MGDHVTDAIEHAELVVCALQSHDRLLKIEAEYHAKIREYCAMADEQHARNKTALLEDFDKERAELRDRIAFLERAVAKLEKPRRAVKKKPRAAKQKAKAKPKRRR